MCGRSSKTAEAAAALDPSYRRNVEALKAVQPADLLPGDISARLGSSWIPASDVKDFICETLDMPEARRHRQPFRRHRHLGADPRQLREIQRQQHHDLGHAAGAGHRPHRGRAQRTHAHHLRPDRQGHARRQPAGNASPRARRSRSSRTDSANGYGRTRNAPSGLPAITTTRSTTSACAPTTART